MCRTQINFINCFQSECNRPTRRGRSFACAALVGLALLRINSIAFAEQPTFRDISSLLSRGISNSVAATNAIAATNLTAADSLDDKYKIAIGDRLSFRIIEDEEDAKPLAVTDAGDMEVPYIGRFPAAGKTCKTLARELKVQLEKEYYLQATVMIAVDQMARSRGKVYVFGSVRMAGPQDIPSDEVLTLSKAILRAGGFNEQADKHNVRITRAAASPGSPDQILKVNVAAILEKGRSENDVPLQPGDLIYVQQRLFNL